MLRTRIMAIVPVALVAIASFYSDIHFQTGWGVTALMAIFTAFAGREFYRMASSKEGRPFALFGTLMSIVLVVLHEVWLRERFHGGAALLGGGVDLLLAGITATVLGVCLLQIYRYGPEGAFANIGRTLLGIIYIWFLPSFLAKMRHLQMPGGNWVFDGIEFIFICIFVAKISDVGGLLVGSQFGKHKLCPTLSPGKTWEGMFGGITSCVVVISVVILAAPQSALASLGWGRVIGLGVLLAVTSLVGDLLESAFKRDSERKDAGTAVPGFGGVLDVVDSLMVSAPAMYYYLLWCGARGGE